MINRVLITLAALALVAAGYLAVTRTPYAHGAPTGVQHLCLTLLAVSAACMFALYGRVVATAHAEPEPESLDAL